MAPSGCATTIEAGLCSTARASRLRSSSISRRRLMSLTMENKCARSFTTMGVE
jgi:hypothetical protein